MSWKDWKSVLRLARMWDMQSIATTAVSNVSKLPANQEEWIDTLRLSVQWNIADVRKTSIERLTDTVSGVDRVLLGIECHILDWVRSGYEQLVQRAEEISVRDEERLGHLAAVKIFRIRDRYLAEQYSRGYYYESDYHFKAAIEQSFEDDFLKVRKAEKRHLRYRSL